jgi:hypothetical protein
MRPEASQFTLSWTGPFSWVGETDNLFVSAPPGSGIYVWALPSGDAYLPYYVGETRESLAARSRAHLQCYCSGMYTIYNASGFKMGRKDMVWRGTVYSATFGARLQEFMERLPELVGHVHGMLAALRVFFAPLDLDDRRLRRIEGELARLFAKAPEPYGTFQDEGLSYQRRADHEDGLLVKVENAPRGFVLPATFEA